jgi:2-oxoglutarate dehydrogenase complex dehydrogenase (E1) component-like enzyme
MLNESSVKVNVQTTLVMRCIMCHSYNNSTSFHSSANLERYFTLQP